MQVKVQNKDFENCELQSCINFEIFALRITFRNVMKQVRHIC